MEKGGNPLCTLMKSSLLDLHPGYHSAQYTSLVQYSYVHTCSEHIDLDAIHTISDNSVPGISLDSGVVMLQQAAWH
jgi:hypothetical protein